MRGRRFCSHTVKVSGSRAASLLLWPLPDGAVRVQDAHDDDALTDRVSLALVQFIHADGACGRARTKEGEFFLFTGAEAFDGGKLPAPTSAPVTASEKM